MSVYFLQNVQEIDSQCSNPIVSLLTKIFIDIENAHQDAINHLLLVDYKLILTISLICLLLKEYDMLSDEVLAKVLESSKFNDPTLIRKLKNLTPFTIGSINKYFDYINNLNKDLLRLIHSPESSSYKILIDARISMNQLGMFQIAFNISDSCIKICSKTVFFAKINENYIFTQIPEKFEFLYIKNLFHFDRKPKMAEDDIVLNQIYDLNSFKTRCVCSSIIYFVEIKGSFMLLSHYEFAQIEL